jgi:hypothetical protein
LCHSEEEGTVIADESEEMIMPLVETMTSILNVPFKIYHGTTSKRLDRIQEEGLRCDLTKESPLSQEAVYFAVDAETAAHIARSRAARYGGHPVVLSVTSSSLDGYNLALDINFMSQTGWSTALAYWGSIPPSLITIEPDVSVMALDNPESIYDPEPGKDNIAFDLCWHRAEEFLSLQPDPMSHCKIGVFK